MEITVEFALIDAKDDPYTGYSPCGFVKNDQPLDLGPINGRLSMLMRQEYLTRLYELQQEIGKKYSNLTVEEEPTCEDKVWGNGLCKAEYDAVEKEVMKVFPGKCAKYYT